MPTFVVDPEGPRSTRLKVAAPRRLRSLDGAVIGLLDNAKPGARELFDGMTPKLAELGVKDFVYRRKVHPAGPSPHVAEVADRVDVAISALGD